MRLTFSPITDPINGRVVFDEILKLLYERGSTESTSARAHQETKIEISWDAEHALQRILNQLETAVYYTADDRRTVTPS